MSTNIVRSMYLIGGEGQDVWRCFSAERGGTAVRKEIGSTTHKHGSRLTLSRFEMPNAGRKWVDKPVSAS